MLVLTDSPYLIPIIPLSSRNPLCVWNFVLETRVTHFLLESWYRSTCEPSSIVSDKSSRGGELVAALKLTNAVPAANAAESAFHPFNARKTLSAFDVLTIRTVIGSATPATPILNTATRRLHHNATRATSESAIPMTMKA